MRVSELILEILSRYDVRHIFGVPGDAINDFTFAVKNREDMDFILVRHEESGAFAASAQAKLTGGLACCMGTAGGGAIHLLNGLYDAKLDHAPVVAITGQVATEFIGTGYHQEVDLERLFSDVCVYSKTVMDESQLPGVMLEACKAALSERAPVHINVPTNVAGRRLSVGRTDFEIGLASGETRPCEPSLKRAADLINDHDKVCILAGVGASTAKYDVVNLAARLNAPIVRTLRAKDWIDDGHSDCAGGLGLLGGAPASKAMDECGLLIIIGADYPYTNFYPKKAKIVQIDPDVRQLGKRAHIDAPLQGHAAPTLQALLPMLKEKNDAGFKEMILSRQEKQRADWRDQETSDATPIKPQRLMAEITKHAPQNAIFLCDTGTATAWTARHLVVKGSQRYTLSSGLGTMAFALPGAIGAQLAYPDRPVIAIAGDGGFAMLMADFVTAARYDLPITVVVLDNQKLGFIALEQQGKGLPEHSIDLVNPDFAAFAESCGGVGIRVEKPDELEPALTAAFTNAKATVVSVAVSPDELIIPPKITLDQAYQFGLAKVREALD